MNKKSETIRFVKYISVGASNTIITFLVFTLLRFWGVNEDISNALGYIAGMINSFCWNRKWVFQSSDNNQIKQATWFLIGAGFCWLIQWMLFRILLSQDIHESIAYLIGMVVYTVLNYLFNKMVTFRPSPTNRTTKR